MQVRGTGAINAAIDLFDIGVMAGVKDALSKIKRRKDYARQWGGGSSSENSPSKHALETDHTSLLGGSLIFDKTGTMVVLHGRVICRRVVHMDGDGDQEDKQGKEVTGSRGILSRSRVSPKKGEVEELKLESEDECEMQQEDKNLMCLVEWLPEGM